jgi:starvation-inducible DNA-binding protein
MAKSAKPKSAKPKDAKLETPAKTSTLLTPEAPLIDIGISGGDRRRIAEGLSGFLADSYTLYLKTHNFHWNVTGPMFNSLHLMFEQQYTEQWTALDAVAERIRALGARAPGSYAEFARLSSIADAESIEGSDWREMVRQLVAGNEAVCRTARKVLKTAQKGDDDPTTDLMTQRLNIHEKKCMDAAFAIGLRIRPQSSSGQPQKPPVVALPRA